MLFRSQPQQTGGETGQEVHGWHSTLAVVSQVREETIVQEMPWCATRALSSAYFAPTGAQPSQAMEPAKPVGKKP